MGKGRELSCLTWMSPVRELCGGEAPKKLIHMPLDTLYADTCHSGLAGGAGLTKRERAIAEGSSHSILSISIRGHVPSPLLSEQAGTWLRSTLRGVREEIK